MSCYTWSHGEFESSSNLTIHNRNARPAGSAKKTVGRFVLLALLLTLVLSLSVLVKANAGASEDPVLRTAGHQSVDVAPGDTLWSIASEHSNGRKIRSYISEIKELNGLESSSLEVGQILYLP